MRILVFYRSVPSFAHVYIISTQVIFLAPRYDKMFRGTLLYDKHIYFVPVNLCASRGYANLRPNEVFFLLLIYLSLFYVNKRSAI